jgi:predicted ATP-grasp superfamily ATP-dependent carboligase
MPDADAAAWPPALIVGGDANALSVARSLRRRGIAVHALNHPGAFIRHSRAARWITLAGDTGPAGWERFLLGPDSDHLRGAVLLVCSDEAIDLVVRHYAALSAKFRLEPSKGEVKRVLLDKLETYRAAQAAGIPTPRFWRFDTLAELQGAADGLPYPVIVKPLKSQDFEVFGRKYLFARDKGHLLEQFARAAREGIETVVMEFIPGADDLLCSYNAWIDETGEARLAFTKRIVRRHPVNMGIACCHVTDRNPEAAELGLRFFRHVGLVGFGNVEFKRDARDGRLKIIECNARFTASDCLAVASGVEFGLFSYLWAIGRAPNAPQADYRPGRRLWLPLEDLHAMRALRRQGALSLGGWLASLRPPIMMPLFDWRDPQPAMRELGGRLRNMARRRGGRAGVGDPVEQDAAP